MKRLIRGLRTFQTEYFSQHQELFEQLSHGQNPRFLFITCSDSRVDPNLITQMQVGELFVIRNAGNMIPPFGAANGGEGAALEYALHALGIEQIIICGHSYCGAMKGLLKLDNLEKKMPLVYDWLHHAEATRRLIRENYSNLQGDELLDVTIAENVLTQIENLRTYPVVRSKLYQGKLVISAWVYHIESGEVLMYDAEKHAFVPPQSDISQRPERPTRTYYPGIGQDEVMEDTNGNQLASSQSVSPHPPAIHFPGAGKISAEQTARIYRGSPS